MAVLNESSIGAGLTGSVGEVYYRKQNGKRVVCRKPASYKKPMDSDSVERRDKMKRLMNISKVVNKDPFFHPLWKRADIKGVAGYHKFLSFNHPHDEKLNLDKIRISPDVPEFNVTIKDVHVNERKLYIALNPLGADCGIDFKREQYIGAGAFIVFSNGPVETSKELYTAPLSRQNLPASAEGELSFTLDSDIKDVYKFNEFKNMSLLIMFSSLNSEEQPVKHSQTFIFRM